MEPDSTRDDKLISYWLFLGMSMVFIQIILGGITRLTGSGLSITKWDIVIGAIPPLNFNQWNAAFDLYKQTPQYQHINVGMELRDFKFIFFWEYIHRLWARSMGLVFIIPFLFFLIRKSLTRQLIRNLGRVILFAILAAIFGWIMVVSGLIDRPWVNAYKLTVHLTLGLLLFISIFYTWICHTGYSKPGVGKKWYRFIVLILILASIQFVFGGFVSGMKSALNYPTWPLMNGNWIPDVILNSAYWNLNNFLLYDKSGFMPALVQFIHRNMAFVLFILICIFSFQWYKSDAKWRWLSYLLLGIIVVQISLGILTLLNSTGKIPVILGTLHQGTGILLVTTIFYSSIILKPNSIK